MLEDEIQTPIVIPPSCFDEFNTTSTESVSLDGLPGQLARVAERSIIHDKAPDPIQDTVVTRRRKWAREQAHRFVTSTEFKGGPIHQREAGIPGQSPRRHRERRLK
jgi:hypothetical protein